MEKRTFEFQLDGTVTLEQFSEMTDAWKSLFLHVGKLVGESEIGDTEIESLQYGSAIVATSTSFHSSSAADLFVGYMNESARHAGGYASSDLPSGLDVPVRKLRSVAKKCAEGDGIVIRTGSDDFLIRPNIAEDKAAGAPIVGRYSSQAFGVLSGKLESISSRQGLKAVIYDEVFDRAVRFNLDDSWEDNMRELWSKRIQAKGTIRRDVQTGRPLSISEVQSITEVSDTQDQWLWKEAKGVLRHLSPGTLSEELVKRRSNG